MKEDLQRHGRSMKEVEVEVDEEEEGHLVGDEEGPADSTSQESWHIHSEPGPRIE